MLFQTHLSKLKQFTWELWSICLWRYWMGFTILLLISPFQTLTLQSELPETRTSIVLPKHILVIASSWAGTLSITRPYSKSYKELKTKAICLFIYCLNNIKTNFVLQNIHATVNKHLHTKGGPAIWRVQQMLWLAVLLPIQAPICLLNISYTAKITVFLLLKVICLKLDGELYWLFFQQICDILF